MNRVIAAVAGLAGLWFLLLASPRSAGEAVVKFAMAAVLLVFAYRRFRAAPQKTAEYVKRAEGADTVIDVTPAAAPVNAFAAVLAVAFAAGIVGSGVVYLWVMGLLFAGAAALVLLKDPRGASASRRASLRVGPEGISTGGQRLAKGDVHHLRIKNALGGEVEIVYDANRGIPTGTLVGLAHRRKLAEVAYRVEAEAAGRAHVLAAGLDDTTARGLLTEVGRALHGGAPTA